MPVPDFNRLVFAFNVKVAGEKFALVINSNDPPVSETPEPLATTCRKPPVTDVVPVYVLMPKSDSTPAPVFVMLPLPVTAP